MKYLFLLAVFLFTVPSARAQEEHAQETRSVPAFPGAEGFGAYTVGGRGGDVHFVTNLLDYASGEKPIEGSLRKAVSAEGPRTILFRVAGNIELKRVLEIKEPYVTIAGQSAPGDGITIKNYGVSVEAPQVILRYLRVRPGDVSGEPDDAINIRSRDVILDHCSASWATDETISIIDQATNVTVQWCLIAESLNLSIHSKGEHGYGSLISTPGKVSIHHTAYALHKSRNPRPRDVLLDFRNNLIYGFGDRAGYNGDDSTRLNYIANYIEPLAYSNNADYAFIVGGKRTRLYPADNVLVREGETIRDDWRMIRPPEEITPEDAPEALGVRSPFSGSVVTTHSAEEARRLILADAGATRPTRDAVDRRIIALIRSGEGKIINSQEEVGGWPSLATGTLAPDSDSDGMSDAWERSAGLDPADGGDHRGDFDGDGYTNLEEYLNLTDARAPDYAPLEWSMRTARSVMERNPVFMERWHYEVGVMMKAFLDLWRQTGEEAYFDYLKQTIDLFVEEGGRIRTYKLSDYNLDQINAGKLLFPLYEATGEERYRQAADTLRLQLREHPRTSEGGFWHKKVYPYQIWLDGVYMAGPFLAEYGQRFDDPEAIDDVTREILLVARYLRDPKTGLYYHAWDEKREQIWADSLTGLSRNFWGRGMGWYGMALVDVLDHLSEDHPDHEQIIRILEGFASAVSAVQDPATGAWYQVLDKPTREGNYLEASASAMFVYTLAKAVRKGYLDSEYLEVARRGYEGILNEFVRVDEDGLVDLHKTVSVGGLGGKNQRDGSFAYYMSEPLRVNDHKGVGPFIMAGLELTRASSARTWPLAYD